MEILEVQDMVLSSEEGWDNLKSYIAYWRLNIHKFIEEYFGIRLYDFQKILIYEMDRNTSALRMFMFWASRGLGKSFLTMLYCCARAILYPGTRIVVSSPTVGQSRQFIRYYEQLKDMAPMLSNEILTYSDTKHEAVLGFTNGSTIVSVPCNDNARGKRSHILILDEFRWMDKDMVDSALKPFLSLGDRPVGFKKKAEYKDYKLNETNKMMYLSSIGTKTEWSFELFLSFVKEMSKNNTNYFAIALPYQFGVESGVINKGFIETQLKDPTLDRNIFRMEMECIPYGNADGALFKYESLNRQRRIPIPFLPISDKEYFEYGEENWRKYKYYQPKQENEVRILSADFAVMNTATADETSFIIWRCIPDSEEFLKEIVYIENMKGINTDLQVLRLKQLFYDLECDYCVVDGSGIGQPFFDICTKRTYDILRNKSYPAWSALNNTEVQNARLLDDNAQPVLYVIKTGGAGSGAIHLNMVTIVNVALDRQKIRFLRSLNDSIDDLKDKFDYDYLKSNVRSELSEEAIRIEYPYKLTEQLINQCITIEQKKMPSGGIRIVEPTSTDKKDILMSMLYGSYFIDILGKDMLINNKEDKSYMRYALASNGKSKVINNKFNSKFDGFGRSNTKNIFGR